MYRDRSPLRSTEGNSSDTDEETSLKNNKNNLNKMSNPTTTLSYNDIQLRFNFAKCMVPEYSGGSKDLCFFLKNAGKFIENFTFTDTVLNEYFFQYVLSQIKGEARDLVILNNPPNWNELKKLLLTKYKDPRSEQLLITSLTTCYQLPNQNFEYYANELKLRLQRLKENVQLNNSDENTIKIKNEMFDEQARCTFIAGLKEPHYNYILHLNPSTLDDCINQCRIFDNLQQHNNYLNFMRNNSHKKNYNLNKPQNISNPGLRTPFKQNSFPCQPYNSQDNSQFPRGPVQLPMPRSVHNNFPTNRQVFGTQTNVFRPRNNTNFPRPTPMSVSTRNTFTPRNSNQSQIQNRPYNHFQNSEKNKPNKIIEEIYNVDLSENPETFYESSENPETFYENYPSETENFPDQASPENMT